MRILFVDDLLDTRKLYAMAFEMVGFYTHTVENGLEALMALLEATEPFDIAIIDVEMPLMNGWETLRAIRGLPEHDHLPIIMYSAYDGLHSRGLEEGVEHVMTKPIMPVDMIDAVCQVVEQARQRADARLEQAP